MITKSKTGLGFQCPSCGYIQIKELQAFNFAGGGTYEIACENCKQTFVILVSESKENYEIRALCIDCCTAHSFKIKKGVFWKSPLKEISCPTTQELIMAIGNRENIERLFMEEFYLDEEDSEDYSSMPFEDEEINMTIKVMTAIAHIKELAAYGKVRCRCGGNKIRIEIDRDFIILICEECDVREVIEFTDIDRLDEICRSDEFIL